MTDILILLTIGALAGWSASEAIQAVRASRKCAAKDEQAFWMAPYVDADFETLVRETQR